MSLLIANCTVSVYRGSPLAVVYGPVQGNLQVFTMTLPERLAGQTMGGIATATHKLYLDMPPAGTYKPILDADYLEIGGTMNGIDDSAFALVSYGKPHPDPFTAITGVDLSYLTLYLRSLGVKKVGDIGPDSSGVLKIGPR